tara:strand:- start:638 stop:1432 length:795 start_codon:yes stop_codon:yes gene_type:complete
MEDELVERAKALGIKNADELDESQLEERISVLLRVRAEGLTRLEFDENRQLRPTLENLRILQIEPVQKKSTLTRDDVIQKLSGYSLLTNKYNTTNNRWTRYIDTDDGYLRGGGFPIRNNANEPFIVMKNVSQKYTFSIQRETVILFEKIPKGSPLLTNPVINNLVSEFRDKRDGSLYVAMNDIDFAISSSLSIAELSRLTSVNRGILARKFRGNEVRHKQFYLFRLSKADLDLLTNRVGDLSETDKLGNSGVMPDVMTIINHYY